MEKTSPNVKDPGKKHVFRLDASGLLIDWNDEHLRTCDKLSYFWAVGSMLFCHVGHFSFLRKSGWCQKTYWFMPIRTIAFVQILRSFPLLGSAISFPAPKPLTTHVYVCAFVLVTQDACDQQNRKHVATITIVSIKVEFWPMTEIRRCQIW